MINLLIMYDIDTTGTGGEKRLRTIAQKCESIGVRVQNSVFECEIPADVFRETVSFFKETINPDTDNIRIYSIGNNYKHKLRTLGRQNIVITDSYVF